MRRLSKPLLALAVLVLLPLGATAQLACCVGMASMHSMDMEDAPGCGTGMSCCEKAHDDALARHCCEGGETARQSPSVPVLSAAPAAMLPRALEVEAGPLAGVGPAPLPPPLLPDLLALHSVLLI